MKKIPTLFITFIFTLFLSVSVYAKPLDSFTITGTIDFDKETEATFDESRTISGTAPSGTEVIIAIKNENSDQTFVFNIEVGASGIFSKTISLDNGQNEVSLSLYFEGCDTIIKETVINKKDNKIKRTLKQSICIPGEGIQEDTVLFYS